ncbi:MAG: type IX secretion system membrane protein PorP/SprF [Bacteroidia bacterium]|nr:type IX secretion system membrane protein PorP/SprF [Bacteroidia bacterium]
MYILRRLMLIVLLAASSDAFCQDPEFTQFYANPLYLNPAFAGTARCPRVSINYRDQWPALTGTFVTYSASSDQHVEALGGGLGLLVLNDNAGEGTIKTTNISGMYSYQLNVTREFSVKFGLQGSYFQKSVDWDKLTFGDMIDPRYGYIYETQEVRPNTNKSFWDFSAGILGYSNNIYGGVAVNHLTEPEEYYITAAPGSKLPMKITAHIGAVLPIAGNRDGTTYISPNFLYQKQRDFEQYNIGLYVAKAPLVGGLWYRGSDSFIALIGLQQGMFKFGYSYDITVSKLAKASAGSHELSVGLQFPCHPKKKRFRTIKCPSF